MQPCAGAPELTLHRAGSRACAQRWRTAWAATLPSARAPAAADMTAHCRQQLARERSGSTTRMHAEAHVPSRARVWCAHVMSTGGVSVLAAPAGVHSPVLWCACSVWCACMCHAFMGVLCMVSVHCCVCGSMAYTAAAAAAWHRASLQSCTQLLVSVQAAARLRGPCLADEPQCGLPRGGLASAWGLVVHWNSGQRHLHVMHRSCARHECAVLVSAWSQMPPAGPAARRTRTAGRPYEHPMTQ
jgi:hypothetical protein